MRWFKCGFVKSIVKKCIIMKTKLNLRVPPKLSPVIGKKMRTNYFDVESLYDSDAFSDSPMFSVDWTPANAFYVKARLGAGQLSPSLDTSHACPCSYPLWRYINF